MSAGKITPESINCNSLAKEFSRLLTKDLGKDKMQNIIQLNRHSSYKGCCATHNFCDSNVYMAQALQNVAKITEDEATDFFLENIEVIGNAWDIAKKENFYQ